MALPDPSAAPAFAVPTCALCAQPLAASTARANGKPLCASCATKLQTELSAQTGDTSSLPFAIIGGFVGAVLGAVAWAIVEAGLGFRIGFLAVGLGWAVGYGMKLGAGRARGGILPHTAAALAVLSLVLGRYFTFAYLQKSALASIGTNVGYFNPELISRFANTFTDYLGVFDVLWVFLAVGAAWRAMQPSRIRLES